MQLPAAYLTVILIWSTTPLAIKWSAVGAHFAFAVLARMVIGATLSCALIAAFRVGLPLHARARRSYLVGGLSMFFAMLSTYWGARYVDSGLVSVLFGLSPLITSLFAALWLGERALGLARISGMLLGVAGLALIFAADRGPAGEQATLGLLALLAAVLVYSAGMVAIKRIGDDSPPLATTAGTLLVAIPFFTAAWLAGDGQWPQDMPLRTQAAIAYLGVFGSVLGFALYYYVIKHLQASQVALITLVTPVLALLLGHALNGEEVGLRVWAGAGLITLGLTLHQWSALSAWAAPAVARRLSAGQ